MGNEGGTHEESLGETGCCGLFCWVPVRHPGVSTLKETGEGDRRERGQWLERSGRPLRAVLLGGGGGGLDRDSEVG